MGIFDEQDSVTVQMDRVQLISPPPEEILNLQRVVRMFLRIISICQSDISTQRIRTNSTPMVSESTTKTQASVKSKRKRAPVTPTKPSTADKAPQIPETTPNPKPRKQRHARRSATPIPPYEPPTDIFSPPREIFMSPAPTKNASKRKGPVARQTRPRTKAKELRVNTNVRVKQEIPDDIDLLAPMPPPSPTDDPLLLSGPPESGSVSAPISVRETSLALVGEYNESVQTGGNTEDLPPSSPVDGTWGGGWSDSDDGEEREGEGEYTGKWKMVNIRTMQDPPSSATRLRQERWGRPITPHPKALVSEDDDSDTAEPELVKITSVDPRAAARAVAILKQVSMIKLWWGFTYFVLQHDYDCYTKLAKKHRASQSPMIDFAKECRRKSISNAGILKIADRRRRRFTMGVIGDQVIIPGSPVTTLPELLQQAEEEVSCFANSSVRTPVRKQATRDPFKTPTPAKFADREGGTTPKCHPAGPREWTKEDWKVLDACFTDQRINLPGDSHQVLAPVDAVKLEDVVARFIDMVGGQSLVNTLGETWSRSVSLTISETKGSEFPCRNNLLERTKALLKKQRSGSVAPPTTPMSSFPSPWNFSVPDFTPNPRLNEVAFDQSITSDVDDFSFYERNQAGGLPPTLLAPRYSHLLEEARAINDTSPSSDHSASRNQGPSSVNQDPSPQQLDSVPIANNLGSRFRGFFSSYLPILSKSSKQTRVQEQPCLPLPPPSVLQKPRGPVETPVRPLVPRAPHPKDIVHLNHILLKPSNIPRPKPIPKRLVELVPVPHTKAETSTSRGGVMPRPRRSSGSSVKDLVRGFEQMEKSTDRSSGTTLKGQLDLRPIWKP